MEAKDPACTEDGNIEYWYCDECGKCFSDAGCTEEINKTDTVIKALGHDWESDYTIDKEPTETEDGQKSIHCSRCDDVKDIVVIPATGGNKDPENPDDPKDPGNSNGNNNGAGSKGDGGNNAVKTGDTTSASVYVLAAGLALAAAGAVCVKRKKNR